MSSWDYISTGMKNLDNIDADGFYISKSFLDKMTLHVCKNFLKLPKIKVPLILGIWGGKGQGKTFQCDLVYKKLGIMPIVMSAGELESGNAGEPAKLVRQRYREASDIVKKGKIYEPEIASALMGITRDTIITLAKDLGYEVISKRT